MDDEPWARKRIATLLKSEPDIEIVGECCDGINAVRKISELSPDLVFLDVQMPEGNGFEVMEAVGVKEMPAVIFVTAYDKYALQAFDANALDYLLKPFEEERFQKALARARVQLEQGKNNSQILQAFVASLRESGKYLSRLAVKSRGRIIFLQVAEIDWLEASGNYVTLHVGREEHLLRTTMNALEPKLDSSQFARIHRSRMVNLDRMKELQPWFQGEQVLLLKDGTKLTVGRAFRERLDKLVKNMA